MLTPEQPFVPRPLSQTTCIAHTNMIYSTIQNMDDGSMQVCLPLALHSFHKDWELLVWLI